MQEMKNKALMNDDIQIKINHVGMTFKDNQGNDVQALKDVNLDIKKGEFISAWPVRMWKNHIAPHYCRSAGANHRNRQNQWHDTEGSSAAAEIWNCIPESGITGLANSSEKYRTTVGNHGL